MKLCKLGLTSKQARVYGSILNHASSISEISEKTCIHKQDIYSIIKKLEKIGLVTKTMAKPTRVESIAIDKALNCLVEIQQKNVEAQKTIVKEILGIVEKKELESFKSNTEEKFFLFPARSLARKVQAEYVMEHAEKSYDLFVPRALYPAKDTIKIFSPLALRNVRIRILTSMGVDELDKISDKKNWPRRRLPNITIKMLCEKTEVIYAIVDDKELWLELEMNDSGPYLVSNSKAIVRLAQNMFEKNWNDKKTVTLLEHNAL